MELSSVSPPAASPTEGADLCEIDVTNVAIHSVTLLICLCGLPGNGAALRLLRWKGCTGGIFGLAITDFLFLLFALPSTLLFLLEDVSCSPIMPNMYLSFIFQMSVVSCYWPFFWLTEVSIKKDMEKLCKFCCCCDLPNRLMWVVQGARYLAFFALFTAIPMVTFLCPSHEQEHCWVALISMFAVILLLFLAPMNISNIINIINAMHGSQQQQPIRRKIVITLTMLFALLPILWNFLEQLSYIALSSQVFFLLTCIHSSIKPFIYFLVGRYWRSCPVRSLRESLQRVFEEPEENTPSSNGAAMDTLL